MKERSLSLNIISKSEGPDGMHPRLLKELASELCIPFKMLFDKTLIEGKLPSSWKNAEVKPIFKKGDKASPGNYRPISLTSIVSKIFEGFIRDALVKHLKMNNLLSNHQFGFCAGRSCVTQLLNTIADWIRLLEDDEPIDCVYLDLQKAFDKVPHARLLVKLKGYGVDGAILKWIEDFLTGRTQFVNVSGECSGTVPVTSGVPQGSVLGPTLFLYFVNDMPDVVDCLIKMFADDTKAYKSVINEEKAKTLQVSIDNLVKWTDDWQLKFNKEKCKVLHIGKNNPNYTYKMDDYLLGNTAAEKDLGVTVDTNLTFEEHINETVKKANRLVGMISHFISHKTPDIMIPLFKTLVRPVLEYGNVVWSPKLRKHIDHIEKVQQRFTKRIIGMGKLDYVTRLKQLNLPSLEYRRLRGDMIETFKMTHDLYDPCTTSTLLTDYNIYSSTRGHSFKLTKKPVKNSTSAQFFTNRIINNWNNLPSAVVTAGTLNSFKNKLDKHWEEYKFQTNFRIV